MVENKGGRAVRSGPRPKKVMKSMTYNQIAELEARIGNRGTVKIDSTNRGDAKKWITANGIDAAIARTMTVAELSACYNGGYEPLGAFQNMTRIFLITSYNDKEAVKALGAKWDKPSKLWWIRSDQDKTPFSQWLDVSATATPETAADPVQVPEVMPETPETTPETVIIPDLPVVIDAADLTRLDTVAGAVVPGVSITSIYDVAKIAIQAARKIEAAAADPEPFQHIKISGGSGFVAPSWSREFMALVSINATVALTGPSGNGKTYSAGKMLQDAGHNVYEIDCHESLMPEQFIGRTDITTDANGNVETTFKAKAIAQAMADPNGAIILNEYDALDPRVGMSLQTLFEIRNPGEARRLSVPDNDDCTLTAANPNMPVVVTMNTLANGPTREFTARNAADGANKGRLTVLQTGYENESLVLQSHGHSVDVADKLENWARKIRRAIEHVGLLSFVSLRHLIVAARLIEEQRTTLEEAVNLAFFGGEESEDVTAIKRAA